MNKFLLATSFTATIFLSACGVTSNGAQAQKNELDVALVEACSTMTPDGGGISADAAAAFGKLSRLEPSYLSVTKSAVSWDEAVRERSKYGPQTIEYQNLTQRIVRDMALLRAFCSE